MIIFSVTLTDPNCAILPTSFLPKSINIKCSAISLGSLISFSAEKLINDPKEIAEHLMLIDLGRNDVGKIAQFGSVKVTEKMIIEKFSHVMHITSNVVGRLKDELVF